MTGLARQPNIVGMALPLLDFIFLAPSSSDTGESGGARPPRQHWPVATDEEIRNDRGVFERMQQGDADALQTLYETFSPSLLRFAYHLVGTRDAAEDLVHTVFLTLWTSRERLTLKGTLSAYLHRAVRNTALKDLAHARVVERTAVHGDDVAPGMGTLDSPADTTLEAAEDVRRAVAIIRQLPERQRTAVLLRWHSEMTTEMIAGVMGISRQGVEKLLRAALAKLRAAFPDRS